MDKMDGLSLDLEKQNINKIKELFPEAVEEGKINFEVLRAFLGDEVDDSREKYQFTWPGKMRSIKIAQLPSSKTLVPCKKESVNWPSTKNYYLKGDNLEVLKQLQKTYYGKIDVIYIDPPYNTGTNLIYKNNFSSSPEEYLKESGQTDEDGNLYVSNPKSNGRFHSDWLSMMYQRLILAKNLLCTNGIIAIAMDESEIGNLHKLCLEIFGESNVLGIIITKCNPQGRGAKNLDPIHEYHIVCAKNIDDLEDIKIKRNDDDAIEYQGLMRSGTNSRKEERPFRFYPILEKQGTLSMITDDEYGNIYANQRCFDEKYINNLAEKYKQQGYNVIFPIAKNGEEKVWQRQFSRVKNEISTYIYENGTIKTPKDVGKTPFSLWDNEKYNNVENGTNLVKKIFCGSKVFDYAKSIFTVKDIISFSNNPSALVLDFFSGSATTAHAVMQMNAEDGGNRKFIMVQLPEVCDEKSEAYKAGYKNICEIGEERIRRAGEQIKADWEKEHPSDSLFSSNEKFNVDIGFKVFKLDSTNIVPWDSSEQYNEDNLFNLNDVFKNDRSNEDVLYEIMLKYGVFDKDVEEIDINGKTMYRVGKRYMIVCLEDKVTEADVKAIGELSPKTVIFKESGFVDDNAKINAVYNLEKAGVEDIKCI